MKRKIQACIPGATVAVALLAAFATKSVEAQCGPGGENAAVPASTPAGAFAEAGDGTVVHLPTGLVWQRCALGQDWTGAACIGTPDALRWDAALTAADLHVQDGAEDWRVPNRNELASIVEDRCHGPALNGTVFPDAADGAYWTGSPVTGQADQAWTVDFAGGAVLPATTAGLRAVRLVRGGQH